MNQVHFKKYISLCGFNDEKKSIIRRNKMDGMLLTAIVILVVTIGFFAVVGLEWRDHGTGKKIRKNYNK